jgi:hypothetical protein
MTTSPASQATPGLNMSDSEGIPATFTKGPWLAGTGGGGGATTFVYETGEDGKQKSAIAGCTLRYVERPMDERIANARLIAAAPELLSALYELREIIPLAVVKSEGEALPRLIRNADAAIAKALGQ